MTSDEARKITQEALCKGNPQTLSVVFDKIREAASRGETYIYLEDSSLKEREQLRLFGYAVAEHYDDMDFGYTLVVVSW